MGNISEKDLKKRGSCAEVALSLNGFNKQLIRHSKKCKCFFYNGMRYNDESESSSSSSSSSSSWMWCTP